MGLYVAGGNERDETLLVRESEATLEWGSARRWVERYTEYVRVHAWQIRRAFGTSRPAGS